MSTFCFGCMKQKAQSPICEHCGFDEETQNLPHQLPQGTILNRQYMIGRVLGQGGFGITYMGWDQHLSLPVAIKEYYPSGMVQRNCVWGLQVSCTNGRSPEQFEKHKDRFIKEARTLAQLSGIPEIVQVRNYFSENGTAYIVMEYVQGKTLKEYLKELRRPMSIQEALEIMEPVLKALEKVHDNHLIHRDISPDNIMLPHSGGVKLIDFGTVRDLDGNHSRSTETALKPGFAPMEQYNVKGNMGPWTDVYALCATFYYLLTGKLPPDAPTRIEEGEDLPLLKQVPGISESVLSALKQGMAIRSADRIQSVGKLRDFLYATSLVSASRMDTNKTTIVYKKKSRTLWIFLGLTAAVILAVFTLFVPKKNDADPIISIPDTSAIENEGDTLDSDLIPETAETFAPAIQEPQLWINNVLRSDGDFSYEIENSTVYDTPIYEYQITSITFLDEIPELEYDPWDFSADRNGSVVGWVEGGPATYALYIAADGGINVPNEVCRGLFAGYRNVESITFNGAFHTDYATDTSNMFWQCRNLQQLDISSLNTSNVRSMNAMFFCCNKLVSLDLSAFDTSNVTDMRNMFAACVALTDLRLDSFNTSSVTQMGWMFNSCYAIQSLDLSHFDTASVTQMSYMFNGCCALEELDLSGFSIESVTEMNEMFADCYQLKNLDLSGWNTSRVKTMEAMFASCRSLERLDLSHFDTAKVTNMVRMFADCTALKELYLGDWEVNSVTEVYEFYPGNNLPDGTPWTKLFW